MHDPGGPFIQICVICKDYQQDTPDGDNVLGIVSGISLPLSAEQPVPYETRLYGNLLMIAMLGSHRKAVKLEVVMDYPDDTPSTRVFVSEVDPKPFSHSAAANLKLGKIRTSAAGKHWFRVFLNGIHVSSVDYNVQFIPQAFGE